MEVESAFPVPKATVEVTQRNGEGGRPAQQEVLHCGAVKVSCEGEIAAGVVALQVVRLQPHNIESRCQGMLAAHLGDFGGEIKSVFHAASRVAGTGTQLGQISPESNFRDYTRNF